MAEEKRAKRLKEIVKGVNNMQFDLQYIFNTGVGALTAVGVYLFNQTQSLGQRVQRLEDVQGNSINLLINNSEKMQTKIDNMSLDIQALKATVHNQKNSENQLNATLTALLKQLERMQHEKDN